MPVIHVMAGMRGMLLISEMFGLPGMHEMTGMYECTE